MGHWKMCQGNSLFEGLAVRHLSKPIVLTLALAVAIAVWAQTGNEEPDTPDAPTPTDQNPMTPDRMADLLSRIYPGATRLDSNQMHFTVDERPVLLVFDTSADRMRLMSPVTESEQLSEEMLRRLMQANFDSALDARYAIAQGLLWSTFIHPLGDLSDELFMSAVGQVVNAAESFGTTFSSGAFLYGGGDGAEEQRELLKKLERILTKRDQA
ncbi:MAG: type III secretion system chaperone [Xanthomonadales bacterium]|nr:type III secretion system chaperone [Xanthomonadales bacterium]